MAKRNIISRLYTVFIVLAVLMTISITAYAAPADENFEGETDHDTGGVSYTLNGMIYTFNDTGGGTILIRSDSDIPSRTLSFNQSNQYDATLATIKTADGSEFKLNSFVISSMGSQNLTISGYRDNTLITYSSFTALQTSPYYSTFDVSSNSNWENIDEIRISAADIWIDIDDLDFSTAVLPTYTVT